MPSSSGPTETQVNPWIVAIAVMFATFMEVLDTTVVNVSLPHIAGSLSVSVEIDTDVPKDKLDQFYRVGSLIRAKVLKVDVDERRLGLGILGIIEQAPEPPEGDVLKGALAEEGGDDKGALAEEGGDKGEHKPKKDKSAEEEVPAAESPAEPA